MSFARAKQPNAKGGRRKKLWLLPTILFALLLLLWACLAIYAAGYARADEDACVYLAANALEADGAWTFGSEQSEIGLILYPGGLVDERAYAPLAKQLSDEGVFVAVASMPYHLAVFGRNRADDIIAKYSGIERWYVGGHSLGGAIAASYASANQDRIDGVILLAAYSEEPLTTPVLSVFGEADTVLDREKYEAYRANLPDDYTERVLTGGNHAQFGNYGAQDGDSSPSISAEEQQTMTAAIILEWLKEQP